MKKWIVPVVIIAIILFWGVGVNNKSVNADEGVSKAWADVEASYQRRNNLIGNLVNTVKGAADFERTTLTEVIEARAKATSISIDPTNITPEQLAQYNQVQGGLSGALKSLLVTVERYPELKANQNFLKLQDELTSTENEIRTARVRYNEAVISYNSYIRSFPTNLFAGILGFHTKPYFESEAGAENPVDVEFDFNN